MPVEVATHAGFCMGVRRAVEMAESAAEDGIPSCTLGDLIHNPEVVRRLAGKGLAPVSAPEEAAGRRVLIRSHGVSAEVMERLTAAGCEILDLTCPFVERLHRIVEESSRSGRPVILVGERDHPEVQGTAGWAHGPVWFVASAEDAEQLPEMDEAVIVSQTTYPPEAWPGTLEAIGRKVKHPDSHYTICNATEIRQQEARELAARADAMIVVGGRNSANTRKLFRTCAERC